MAAVIVMLTGVAVWIDVIAVRHLHRAGLQAARVIEPNRPLSSLEQLFARTFRELAAMLDLRACSFEVFPFDTVLPRIEPGGIIVPADDPGIAPVSYTSIELPVRLNGLTLGRVVLLPHAHSVRAVFSPTNRDAAIAVADELAEPVAAALRSGSLSRTAR